MGSAWVRFAIATPAAKLQVAGDVVVDGNIGAKYQDVAEWVEATESLEPGTVVVIDGTAHNRVRRAAGAYDTAVAGAVSVQPGTSKWAVMRQPGVLRSWCCTASVRTFTPALDTL